MSDLTPCYIAYCPACGGILGCSVADVASPHMAFAVRDRATWERAGLRVETKTVNDVHAHQGPLGHLGDCPKKPREKRRPAPRQVGLSL